MLTLAQPIIVSRSLRSMNSANAPHKARIAPPERQAGWTHERPSSTILARNGRVRIDLPAGHYVVICNVPTHYQLGMRTDLTVQ